MSFQKITSVGLAIALLATQMGTPILAENTLLSQNPPAIVQRESSEIAPPESITPEKEEQPPNDSESVPPSNGESTPPSSDSEVLPPASSSEQTQEPESVPPTNSDSGDTSDEAAPPTSSEIASSSDNASVSDSTGNSVSDSGSLSNSGSGSASEDASSLPPVESGSLPLNDSSSVLDTEDASEEKTDAKPTEEEKLKAEEEAAKKMLPNVATYSARGGGSLADLGGGTIEYYGGPPHIEVCANSSSRFYGDAFMANGVVFKVYGLSEGDVSLADFAGATYEIISDEGVVQDTKTPAGSYTVNCTTNLTSITVKGNIVSVASGAGYAPASVTVNKRPITIAANSLQKEYGNDDPTLTYTVAAGSIVPGDTFQGNLYRNRSGPTTEKVGTYPINSTLSNSNYTITFVPGSLEITRGNILITGTTAAGRDITREYGSVIPAISYTISGLKFNDTVDDPSKPGNLGTVSLTCGVTSTSTPGNYVIAVSGLGTILDNYNVAYANGSVAITKRTINAAANGYTKKYGEDDKTLICTVSAPNAANPSAPDVGDEGSALYPLEYSLARTVGENVGKYPISMTVASASKQYYNVNYTPADVTIATAVLTVTAKDAVRAYGDENPAFSVTYSGFQKGEDESVLSGTLKLTTEASKTSFIKKYPIVPSGLTSANYEIKFVSGLLKVEPRVVFATMQGMTKVYGQPDEAMTYTLEEEPIDPIGSPLIGVPFRELGEEVGSYQMNANFDNINYNVIVDTANYEITPAALRVKPQDETRIYGDANPTFSLSYEGFAFHDGANAVTGTPVFNTSAVKTSSVGDYTVSVSGLSAKNYNITFDTGKLKVTPRPITVTLDDKTQVYGAEEEPLTYSLSEPLIDPENSPLNVGMSRVAGDNVGDYSITGTFTNSNYTITVKDGIYSITPAGLVVRVNDTERVYGGENPDFTISYEGLQNGDSSDAFTGELVFKTEAVQKSFVGNYEVTASGLTNGNYNVTFAPGTLKITQRALVVSADSKTQEYGEAALPLTYKLSEPLIDAVDSPLVGNLVREAGENAGRYAITGAFTNSNYTISFVPNTYTITTAPLTVSVDDATRIYGDENPDFTLSFTGFKNGEDAAALGGNAKIATDADKLSSVGDYTVSVDGFTSGNYTITFADGTLSVTPRALIVTLDDKTQVYGAEEKLLTYSLSEPLIDPKNSPLNVGMSRAVGDNVGDYAITGTFTNTNYTIKVVDGIYSITPAGLVVRVNDTERVYGGENPDFTVSYEGLQNGDGSDTLTGELVFQTDAVKNSFVGDYNVTASGLTNGNYNVAFALGTLKITQRPLFIFADDKTKEYGDVDEELTYTLSDALVDETGSPLVGELTREQGENVDKYLITSSLANANYDIHYVPASYIVTPAPLTVTVNDTERVYGDKNPNFTVTGGGFKFDDDFTDLNGKPVFTTDADKNTAVGEYPVTVDGLTSKNYTVTFVDGKLTISPRPITVTVDSKTQVYGDKEKELTYALSEKIIDPSSPIQVTLTKPEGKDANAYIITGTAENPNYIITVLPGIYIITPAPLTITVNDKERENGTENPAFDVTYDGFKNEETETVLTGELVFKTDANTSSAGGDYTVSASGVQGKNYTITFVDGKLTVAPAPTPPAPQPPTPANPATGNSFFEKYIIFPIMAALAAIVLAVDFIFTRNKKRKRARMNKQEQIFVNKFNQQNKK